ncbi:MAG: DinB family protein [Chloroflexi bacterium]|nr:MAG: DinB family protein [Chloroflexota bacterium]
MADTDRIIKKITQARRQLLSTVEGLTEEQMAWSPNQEWSIREILHHVAIGEQANVELAERALAGEPVAIEDFDMDAWNIAQVANKAGRPAAEAIQALQTVREKTLNTLRSLSSHDLAQTLDHPGWGEMTVEQLFRALGVHDLMHRRDILKRIEQLEANS